MALTSMREGLRELLLLEQTEKNVAALSESQRATMRIYQDAASRRLNVARDVRGPSQTPVALELYRQGGLFYALAFLVSKDAKLDATALTPEHAFRELTRTLEAQGSTPPPELARVMPLFLTADPLGLDRLPTAEAEQIAADFETTTRWLANLFDARSPTEVKVLRVARVGAVAASLVLFLVFFFMWVFAPKNYAKGKPAFSSSTMFSTVPAGAVDGSKSGQYGFHSSLEDSPWLSIDLGAPLAIKRAKVYGRGDGYYDQSIPLAFEVSEDGVTYRAIATRNEPFSADDPWVINPAGLVTRFIRLHTMRKSYLVLGEVEVFGEKPH